MNELEHLSALSQESEQLIEVRIADLQRKNSTLKIIAAVFTAGTIGLMAYALTTYPRQQTITTNAPICNVADLVVPSDDSINVFLQKLVPRTFSFDFKNYRQTLNALADRFFNEKGKAEFFKALDDSDNLKSVIDSKLILSTSISAPPQISNKYQDANGIIHWETQTPVRISFTDPKRGTSQERSYIMLIDLAQSIVAGEQIDGVLANGLILAPDTKTNAIEQ